MAGPQADLTLGRPAKEYCIPKYYFNSIIKYVFIPVTDEIKGANY